MTKLTRPCLLVLLSIGQFIWLGEASRTHASELPNFVLVMCDDLGWGDVGFNGGQIIQTPCLDEMAQHSLQFSRFYAQAPVCSPTRGSCMTGRHPFRYGIPYANSGHMKPPELTLAELLREHGYATGHFGKWHLGTLTRTVRDANRGGLPKHVGDYAPPQDNGFEVCFSTESKVPTYDPMLKPAKGAGNAWDALADPAQGVAYGTYYWNEKGERVTENLAGCNSRIIMDRAEPFLRRSVADGRPFFAVIWFHSPHLPVVAGPEHRALYPDADDVRTRNYYGCVTAMDQQMGRLRQLLRELNVQDNTMLAFCSDNGPEGKSSDPGSAGHFRGRKRSLYEGGIRVPGLIEWPREVTKHRVTDYPAVTSDYLPTILDYLDVRLPDGRPVDGVSLRGVFQREMHERPQPIGFQSRGQLALSDNRFKLIRAKPESPWQLFDLLDDPTESNDVAEDHPELVDRMSQTLIQWQASCTRSSQGLDYPDSP